MREQGTKGRERKEEEEKKEKTKDGREKKTGKQQKEKSEPKEKKAKDETMSRKIVASPANDWKLPKVGKDNILRSDNRMTKKVSV